MLAAQQKEEVTKKMTEALMKLVKATATHYFDQLHQRFRHLLLLPLPSVVLRTLMEARGTVAAARGSRCDGNFPYNLTGNK